MFLDRFAFVAFEPNFSVFKLSVFAELCECVCVCKRALVCGVNVSVQVEVEDARARIFQAPNILAGSAVRNSLPPIPERGAARAQWREYYRPAPLSRSLAVNKRHRSAAVATVGGGNSGCSGGADRNATCANASRARARIWSSAGAGDSGGGGGGDDDDNVASNLIAATLIRNAAATKRSFRTGSLYSKMRKENQLFVNANSLFFCLSLIFCLYRRTSA